MNLNELFELQAKLDAHIEKEHPRQPGEDRLAKKILALQVELGELANELPEVFKFWSNKKNNYEKALEELVDCIHFILSIGLEIGESGNLTIGNVPERETLTVIFNDLFRQVAVFQACMHDLKYYVDDKENFKAHRVHYSILLDLFLELGRMLGFTWEQIKQAYLAKNKINHERQDSGVY